MVQQARQLHRSQDNRFLFGVAGGLAEYFDVEPVLVRVGWVLLTIATAGIAALAYIVMAIFTPDSGRQQKEFTSEPSSDSRAGIVESDRPSKRHILRNILGVGLIVAGMIILLGNLGVFGSIPWEIVWPVAISLLGVVILLPSIRR
ncbi:MAG: PspC domain-containing protein [Dehalococcoidia bacterium]|nr:PspC domain-containing protein [Dehalococcoidia bacterium]